jgi:hypothetical protein
MDTDAGIGMDTDMDMAWTCFASIFSQLPRNSDYRLSEKGCDSRTQQEAINVHISRKIEHPFVSTLVPLFLKNIHITTFQS